MKDKEEKLEILKDTAEALREKGLDAIADCMLEFLLEYEAMEEVLLGKAVAIGGER